MKRASYDLPYKGETVYRITQTDNGWEVRNPEGVLERIFREHLDPAHYARRKIMERYCLEHPDDPA